ncbi:hypothetical protein C4D60_Mb03t03450 [Musa balbisiana]|uniref:Uncharacterized protein n=1 Tax=Musa balbisiana TaxID=52838 RepID=A0A4S8J7A6_MUSBA|nr:hypothetical protein C4D60_Mb03t03450 [Musa balbisiana]
MGIFVLTASHFVLSCTPTHRTYNMVVKLFFTSASYLYLFAFVHHYDLHRLLFLDKLVEESEQFVVAGNTMVGDMVYAPWSWQMTSGNS